MAGKRYGGHHGGIGRTETQPLVRSAKSASCAKTKSVACRRASGNARRTRRQEVRRYAYRYIIVQVGPERRNGGIKRFVVTEER